MRPIITGVKYNGGGTFPLTGKQLNGQSAGAAYGDDDQMESNYPIIRMVSGSGNVYYARTTNWSKVSIDGGHSKHSARRSTSRSISGSHQAITSSS